MDTIESLLNAIIGLLASWAATYWLFPILLNVAPSAGQSAGIVALFFVLSFVRARLLRAVFRRVGG